jgi:arylsulfatase A-like enzyme
MLGCGAVSLLMPAAASAGRRSKPNFVFFLVDDMGWMDAGCYGSKYYETPNIDKLAGQGMLFTDAYAANPLCSPTRASILTGKYPARLKITTPAGHLPKLPADRPLLAAQAQPWQKVVTPVSRRYLPLEENTIAEALTEAGYKTGFIGKWHLGKDSIYWPEHQGFDVNVGGAGNPGPPSYHSPYRLNNLKDGPTGEYITDRLTDEALRYIESSRKNPFMLFLWHFGVHGPWGHKEEITKRYLNKKDPRGKQNNPIMASMLESIDQSLGRVMDRLDKLGLSDNTIVVFFSDNGGNTHSRIGPDELPATNNYPLRGGKATIYEGGTREPLIVRWPGVVRPGSRCSEVLSSIDFYPTMLEITGAKAREGQVLDGRSILPLLKQSGKLKRRAIFCHFPHNTPATGNIASTYVRCGDFKLIRFYHDGQDRNHRYELYNLAEDISETNNLAAKYPEMVRQLDALIDEHLKETGALVPIPNPRYDPAAKPVKQQAGKKSRQQKRKAK